MIDQCRIQQLADEARRSPPVAGDPRFAALESATTAPAVLVRSPDGSPAFWLVPFVVAGLAHGIARVELTGRVAGVSMLGRPVIRSWFQRPPADALAKIRVAHPDARLSEPVLSYDRAPSRWGWMVQVRQPGHPDRAAHIGFNGWYERPLVPPENGREG